jgi:hypothetical protein
MAATVIALRGRTCSPQSTGGTSTLSGSGGATLAIELPIAKLN